MLRVKAESGHPEGTQNYPSLWGWDWESRTLPGVESGGRWGGQQQKLLWVYLQWWKTGENVGLLLNGAGELERFEVFSATFILVRLALKNLRPLRPEGKSGASVLLVPSGGGSYKQTGHTEVHGA